MLKTVAFPHDFLKSMMVKNKESIDCMVVPIDHGNNKFKLSFFSALGHCEQSLGFSVQIEKNDKMVQMPNIQAEEELIE